MKIQMSTFSHLLRSKQAVLVSKSEPAESSVKFFFYPLLESQFWCGGVVLKEDLMNLFSHRHFTISLCRAVWLVRTELVSQPCRMNSQPSPWYLYWCGKRQVMENSGPCLVFLLIIAFLKSAKDGWDGCGVQTLFATNFGLIAGKTLLVIWWTQSILQMIQT